MRCSNDELEVMTKSSPMTRSLYSTTFLTSNESFLSPSILKQTVKQNTKIALWKSIFKFLSISSRIIGQSSSQVKAWRTQNKYTWHEVEDLKTMQLVPSTVNAKYGHMGGVGEINAGATKP